VLCLRWNQVKMAFSHCGIIIFVSHMRSQPPTTHEQSSKTSLWIGAKNSTLAQWHAHLPASLHIPHVLCLQALPPKKASNHSQPAIQPSSTPPPRPLLNPTWTQQQFCIWPHLKRNSELQY
jgi:hypothetical protein